MKLSNIAGVLIIAVLVTVVIAGVSMKYYHPENGTVGTTTSVKLEEYLDGELTGNGTTLEWGTLNVGVNTWNYTVRNVGSVNCIVNYVAYDLPSGWTETWTQNGVTLEPLEYAVGYLTLVVPATANGFYEWHSEITATEA